MKKILLYSVFFILINSFCSQAIGGSLEGRWAEKISERVVMDVFPDKNNQEYQIYITWRENTLAQKDIYRFTAKEDKNGVLKYKNGVHIYRTFDTKGGYVDTTDYKDGSGSIVLKNNEIVWTDDKDNAEDTVFVRADKNLLKDTTSKNKLFSVMLPEELNGVYETQIKKDKISFYHKSSKKAGFGGFAFGIKAYKNPADHAFLPGGKKIGELTDKKGQLYDIVLKHPTDVQYDYTKSNEAPETFKLLYNIGEVVNIQGIKGSVYRKNQGTKGKDLYGEVLQKHIKAINEKWDSTKLEEENMSYMYNVLASTNKNVLDKIGYTYYDVNADGIEELLIGEITGGEWKGIIYDMYTMVNRKPKHVISGGSRNRYFVCDDVFVCREYSSGANESGWLVYVLNENSTELYGQVGFKYDGYNNPKNPWFLMYGFSDENWENVSENVFKERKQVFEKYERFDYIPLSTINN